MESTNSPSEPHEHQFPEVNQDGTLVAFPCLLCGLSVGDALKQAAEDRQSFQDDITRDVEVIRDLEQALAAKETEIAGLMRTIDADTSSHALEIARLREECTDWLLVADGVKHDWRCTEDTRTRGDGTERTCLRCQLAEMTRERDNLVNLTHEKAQELTACRLHLSAERAEHALEVRQLREQIQTPPFALCSGCPSPMTCSNASSCLARTVQESEHVDKAVPAAPPCPWTRDQVEDAARTIDMTHGNGTRQQMLRYLAASLPETRRTE